MGQDREDSAEIAKKKMVEEARWQEWKMMKQFKTFEQTRGQSELNAKL